MKYKEQFKSVNVWKKRICFSFFISKASSTTVQSRQVLAYSMASQQRNALIIHVYLEFPHITVELCWAILEAIAEDEQHKVTKNFTNICWKVMKKTSTPFSFHKSYDKHKQGRLLLSPG